MSDDKEIKRLRAEVKRYRAALQAIVDSAFGTPSWEQRATARNALAAPIPVQGRSQQSNQKEVVK